MRLLPTEFRNSLIFYFIALIFTILGLAVETAEFGASSVATAAELIGLVLLLFAGVVGLARLEWQPQLFQLFSIREWHKNVIRETSMLIQKGQKVVGVLGENRQVELAAVRSGHEKSVTELEGHADRLVNLGVVKYRWQRGLFLMGLAALMVARGMPALAGLFGYSLR